MEISVIIPVYNAERFVERAVHSALAQPETGEVLLIDDASTDGSWAICKQLANENERVKLFQHEDKQNNGPGATRNIGLKNAAYDFIAFLDADDYYVENRFKAAKKIFTLNENVDGVYESIIRYFLNDQLREMYVSLFGETILYEMPVNIPPNKVFEVSVLDHKAIISLNGLVIKRAIINKVGLFDTKLKKSEDTDWIWRLSIVANLVSGKNENPVAYSCIHGGNIVLKYDLSEKMKTLFYEKWLEESLINDWSSKINRHILNHFMYYHPSLGNKKDSFVFRILFKLITTIKLIIDRPIILKKLL